jgi:hypothetical protein
MTSSTLRLLVQHIFLSQSPRTDEKLRPTRPLGLRVGFNPPEKIALRYDADDVPIAIQYGQATDLVLKHKVRRLQDRCLGLRRNDITRHDVRGLHHKSPCVIMSLLALNVSFLVQLFSFSPSAPGCCSAARSPPPMFCYVGNAEAGRDDTVLRKINSRRSIKLRP